MAADSPELIGFYSDAELDRVTSLSRTTRWREVKAGRFPKPVELSPGRKGTEKRAVHEWIARRLGRGSADATQDAAQKLDQSQSEAPGGAV
jgi:prophage regulatory protein